MSQACTNVLKVSRSGIKPDAHLLMCNTCTELVFFPLMLRRLSSYAEVLAHFAGWYVNACGCCVLFGQYSTGIDTFCKTYLNHLTCRQESRSEPTAVANVCSLCQQVHTWLL